MCVIILLSRLKSLYLSHPFSYRLEARKIEAEIEVQTGLNIINPFYDTKDSKAMKKIDSGKMKLWQLREREKTNNVVSLDLGLIRKSTVGVLLLVPYGHGSFGAPIEAYVARHVYKKPVYTICYEKGMSHPWIQYVSTAMFPTAKDFISFMNQWVRSPKH